MIIIIVMKVKKNLQIKKYKFKLYRKKRTK